MDTSRSGEVGSHFILLMILILQLGHVMPQAYSYENETCVIPIENSTVLPTNMTTMEPTSSLELTQELPCIRDYSLCNVNGTVTMTTDEFSYIGAWAPVTITVNSSEVDDLLLYYKMCIQIGDTENYRLISCLTRNKSVVDTSVNWKDMGAVVLTVGVYRDAGYSSLVDCADNRIVVANNSGLHLDVKLINSPDDIPMAPTAQTFSRSPALIDSYLNDDQEPPYLIGNMTFVSTVNFSDISGAVKYQFKYDFGDGTEVVYLSNASNVTHYYNRSGTYNYSVHAFVVLEDGGTALHTSIENQIDVYQRVTDPQIVVGKSNSVQVGRSLVTATVAGSFPISLCWCLVYPNTTFCSPLPVVNSTAAKETNITCNSLQNNNTSPVSYTVTMNFTGPGTYQFKANYSNVASRMDSAFNFTVNPPPSPIVVITISGATIGLLASLLVIAIITIIIIVTVVIPYRRYKHRMTETANFKFVDLSESGVTWKGRMRKRASKVASYFRSQKETRVGLVNKDFGTSDQLLNRSDRNVTAFAPYESL